MTRPITDDSEIKLLKALYEHALSKNDSKDENYLIKNSNLTKDDIENSIRSLYDKGYLKSGNPALGGNMFFITFDGKIVLDELEKDRKAEKNAFLAILISIFVGGASLIFGLLDYYGDLDWQKQQLGELKSLNQNIEKLIKK